MEGRRNLFSVEKIFGTGKETKAAIYQERDDYFGERPEALEVFDSDPTLMIMLRYADNGEKAEYQSYLDGTWQDTFNMGPDSGGGSTVIIFQEEGVYKGQASIIDVKTGLDVNVVGSKAELALDQSIIAGVTGPAGPKGDTGATGPAGADEKMVKMAQ